MKLRLVPYKKGSKSAKLLSLALGDRVGYKVWRGMPKAKRLNLPWGKPANKIRNFMCFTEAEVPHVPWTTDKEEATKWLEAGKTVLARKPVGFGGSGITIVNPGDPLPDKPLYTQYVKKRKEFRVHVFNGKVVHVQEKRKRAGGDADSLIRNHQNGWVFCNNNIVEPAGLRELGVRAVESLQLVSGGVDIIWNEKKNLLLVLEVNSAPGLCPSTAEKYADAIVEELFGQ